MIWILSDFGRFIRTVLLRWQAYVTSSLFAAIGFVYEHLSKQMIPGSVVLWGIAVFFVTGAFLAWRDECRRANEEHQKALTLEDRMTSRIRVSCGKSVDKSVVTAAGETWYRARLDLEGIDPIPDIQANVSELWENGKRVPLAEYLTLTMYPGLRHANDPNLKTLTEGTPELVDVIRVADNKAHFPLKFYPRAVAHDKLLTPGHTYKVIVAISGRSNRTDVCTFEFEWTGDPDTSDIQLVNVTTPALSVNG